MRKPRRWKKILVVFLLVVALDYVIYPRLTLNAPPLQLSQNALWLDFKWVEGKSAESIPDLATRLENDGFREVYFHVRYIGKSGRLRFRNQAQSQHLNRELEKLAPQIRRLAWLYIGNARGITGIEIAKPEIRRRIVAETRFLTEKCRFDGLQVDYEICSNGDSDFLQLLREIRAANPNKFLSVATPMWLPAPLGAYGWSESYFAQVAQNCDEIAVMAYDSGLYFPRHYVWLLQQQIERVPRAVKRGNARCEVLLGVPTYESGGASHWPYAENLAMALRSARKAQNAASQPLDGIALFADSTTDATEWALWKRSFSRINRHETQN